MQTQDTHQSNDNVDHQEIQKFAALAQSWWDLHGEFKPLHLMNPTRLNYIASKSDGLFNKRVLDVGCGGGILAESMAKLGGDVLGIDMAEESLNVAKLHSLEAKVDNVDYRQVTVEQLAEEQPHSFDVVTCMEMLEHVPNPESIVAACVKLVKPGGQLFFSTLNRTNKAYLLAIVGAEHLLKLVPKGTHEHKKFIRPSELIRFVDNHQARCLDAVGIHYNPLTEQFKMNNDLSVNYILHCQPNPAQ
ncbi:bifunctional 2-polyprenyl-6-hydroxyphenol methylase/3-demethylubiquinol 3-O-methyltransferase UbiG [Psychrobium sp. 1_MG-2023]|uniref:bifunctional 2-polyprenyl-6-hydroxyphenol methylase/3-demethylubiquinol 3-O-methyltransferase UbiG n=1 Tax=Psychrobium sp. 1_MG-2023 TaxID=3062624 RepID=UPI000C324568|nr:bifunctional 2-polyprenyl-6-hydroxyphenol methylase/3-demethylubiquinol 3-O-methyltransferase UbiG [Psychrobium sp. 1_MG-2023]MDP2560140.1 bifunctional 2-polyprenyl-6-hydroxyphenol methylase/3-demethylubiquinol 3-O-methyltransferase UbiG [Psychrobium sp. 1_MG-2023]PKF56953.1 bifunctional 3-demethylubiquinol 3-O-methyltransferase/2-polyprenyl-6-hydroxyphenol methylase [Alteromonadales bacterium alter-6D02]